MSWAWLLAEVWVVELLAGGRLRCRWCGSHACSIRWACLLVEGWVVLVAVVGVGGVGFVGVRGCGCDYWPGCGWSRGLSAPLALALPVRLRRGVLRHCIGAWCVVAGARLTGGRLVAVVGVDGVGYVRVRGCGCACWPRFGSCCWPWLGSMVRDICMFEHVRGCGWLCWLSSGSSRWSLVDDF